MENAVNQLLAMKAQGKHVYGIFNGYMLDSETVTMDSAFMEVIGCTKAEYDLWWANERKMKNEADLKKEMYKKMVNDSRIPGEDVIITMPIVIEGLKCIAENQSLSQEELVQALIDLGCNFTIDDINKLGPPVDLFKGMEIGDLACGASVILNIRDSEDGRSYCNDRFLSIDDEVSVYHYIRTVTGNLDYTMENILNSTNSNSKRR